MSHATTSPTVMSGAQIPAELLQLRDRVRTVPEAIRLELEPLIDEAMEHARFRDSVLVVAKEALSRFRLDLEMTRFDLEATRREREMLENLIGRDM